jgi:2,4-dienoyl-CoA reductase-like NADH-dependent reductase (Old Yellow Enzyme family)
MPNLFDPLRIKALELKNRIVFAPIATHFGLRNERAMIFFAARARGGVGLIIVHGTPVDLLIKADWARSLRTLVSAVHEQGAKIVLQLWHGNDLNGQAVAPSARESYRQISREEIRTVIDKFATAARNCREAGFDGVEVHGAHGYFIHQFFSPLTNRRTDEYGGTVEGRMLLAMELVVAMRQAAGESLLLLYRHSAVDGLPGGTTVEESARLAKALENHWLDGLDVSAGMGGPDDLSLPPASAAEGTHAELAGQIKAKLSIPVIAVGRVQTRAVAEKILHEKKADLVALGRQLLADPNWPKKVQEGKEDEIIFCNYCGFCGDEMRAGRPIACPQNPDLGKETLRV